MQQVILEGINSSLKVTEILSDIHCHKFLLVCKNPQKYYPNIKILDKVKIPYINFSDYTPNPQYEDVCKGVDLFQHEKCDAILAIGGGSTIDVAKCIKLFCKLNKNINYLKQAYFDSGIPLIAVPTTAGSGSESTRFAVIYFEGKKQSIMHESLIPNYAILDSCFLRSLPLYQKKCTMLDALCQGIESWWSINSTDESKRYSKLAVELITENYEGYLTSDTDISAEQIMIAANYSGKAINITQTTAAHAMSYMLTSIYNLPHGHAVAICLPHIWRYMNDHLDRCIDERGQDYLKSIFEDISNAMGCRSVEEAIRAFERMMIELGMKNPMRQSVDDIKTLTSSVNTDRLNNNPVRLDEETLFNLYNIIVGG